MLDLSDYTHPAIKNECDVFHFLTERPESASG